MKVKDSKSFRTLMILAAALFGGACIAQGAAGPAPTAQVIVVTATDKTLPGGSNPGATSTPTAFVEMTSAATAESTVAAGATAAPVTMTAGQDLSCVKGPHWILYEWVASIPKGETVALTARSTPSWPDYYYVRRSDGTECWAFGASSTITGDPASLPVMEAPPLPTVSLTIDNKNLLDVYDVFIRAQDSSDWGADRLGAGTIAPTAAFTLSLTAGFYDIRIKDMYGGVLYEKENSAIGPKTTSNFILKIKPSNRYAGSLTFPPPAEYPRTCTRRPTEPLTPEIPSTSRCWPGYTISISTNAATAGSHWSARTNISDR
jgi:hypothetical protein